MKKWKSSRPVEADEMRTLLAWLNINGIVAEHSPNEGKRSFKNAAFLKSMGMQKGMPDLKIFTQTGKAPHGAVVELKRTTRAKPPTLEQAKWLDYFGSIGWPNRVCYGAQDAIDWLKSLGYGTSSQKRPPGMPPGAPQMPQASRSQAKRMKLQTEAKARLKTRARRSDLPPDDQGANAS